MKYIRYLIIGLCTFFLFSTDTFASTKTYDRSDGNYRVPKDVQVTEKNYKEILDTPAVNEDEKIYDFANLFIDSQERDLYNELRKFIKDTGIDSVIVTTNDLKGYTLSKYAYNFYDYNDFLNEGIIFIIYKDPETNAATVFMGNNGGKKSKVFRVYNEPNINSILEYVYENDIRYELYYKGCTDYLKITKGLYEKTFGNYTVDSNGNIVNGVPWGYVILIAVCLTFITVVLTYNKSYVKTRRVDTSIKRCVSIDTMYVKKEYDNPIDSNKVRL